MPAEVSPVRTVNRIADILNCFSEQEPILNLTAISARLGLPKSTVHRLLAAMEVQGFLTREARGRGFQLGYQLLHWGVLVQSSLDLRSEARPLLRELCDATGETAILSVRDGNRGVCLDMVESAQPVRLTMRVGQRLQLHAGASAKVLWAFLPPAEVNRLLADLQLAPLQAGTITDRERLCDEVMAIRSRGYATSHEETDAGAMGVAAPVYDHSGLCVAGVGIAAPLARITPDRAETIARLVVEAGRRISARLGARDR